MDKNTILKHFLEDPVLQERSDLSQDELRKVNFFDKSGSKLIEIIKETILRYDKEEDISIVSRRLTRILNDSDYEY